MSMKKRNLLIPILIIILIFLVGCTEQISDDELDKELEQLSEEELEYVLAEDEAVVGEALRIVYKKDLKLSKLQRVIDFKRRVSICTDTDTGRDYLTQGTAAEGGKSFTDYCQDSRYLFEYDCGYAKGINFQDGCGHSGLGGCRFDCQTLGENYVCEEGACVEKTGTLPVLAPCGSDMECVSGLCDYSPNLHRVVCVCGDDGDCPEGEYCDRKSSKLCKNYGTCFEADCLDYGGEQFDFLIVTRPLFVNSLDEFVTWKNNRGFNVGVITVDFIVDNYAGENVGIKIRNAIHSMKELNGVHYVLLIGDTIVDISDSAQGFSEEEAYMLASYDLTSPWNVPTMYYNRLGDVDRPDLDLLGPSDLPYSTAMSWLDPPIVYRTELNFVPEVYVGRWPIRTTDELNQIVENTKNVRQIENLLLLADDSLLSDEIEAHERCDEWPPSERNDEFYCYNDIFHVIRERIFEGNIDYSFVPVNLLSGGEAANAYNLFLATPPNTALIESFHGSLTTLGLGTSDGWPSTLNVHQFENSFPLFHSSSCSIGAYYQIYEDVYAEALIKNEKGPVFFVQAPNDYYFFESLLKGKTIGEAFYSGTNIYVFGPNPYYLFGDPSVSLIGVVNNE